MADRLAAVLEESGRVRAELGWPIMVTPFSQHVAVQAALNIIHGERYGVVLDEVKLYALGYFGKLPAPVEPDVLDRIIERGSTAIALDPPEPEPAVERLRRQYPGIDDEERMLRYSFPEDVVDDLYAPARRQPAPDDVRSVPRPGRQAAGPERPGPDLGRGRGHRRGDQSRRGVTRERRVAMARTIRIVDTTLRDGHQCLWATRMPTAMMLPVADAFDRSGFWVIEMIGAVQFDACMRFIGENPWSRIRELRRRISRPLQVIMRSNCALNFDRQPVDINELWGELLARNGLDRVYAFDGLHDYDNTVPPTSERQGARRPDRSLAALQRQPRPHRRALCAQGAGDHRPRRSRGTHHRGRERRADPGKGRHPGAGAQAGDRRHAARPTHAFPRRAAAAKRIWRPSSTASTTSIAVSGQSRTAMRHHPCRRPCVTFDTRAMTWQ